MKKQCFALFLPVIALAVLAGFSTKDSQSDKRDDFVAILWEDGKGGREVHDLAIASRTNAIRVYSIPSSPDLDPKSSETNLDLIEIEQIIVARSDGRVEKHTYKNRGYITLQVLSRDSKGTLNKYIIDEYDKVTCTEPNEAGPIERRLAFDAIDRITSIRKQEVVRGTASASTATPPSPALTTSSAASALEDTVTTPQAPPRAVATPASWARDYAAVNALLIRVNTIFKEASCRTKDGFEYWQSKMEEALRDLEEALNQLFK